MQTRINSAAAVEFIARRCFHDLFGDCWDDSDSVLVRHSTPGPYQTTERQKQTGPSKPTHKWRLSQSISANWFSLFVSFSNLTDSLLVLLRLAVLSQKLRNFSRVEESPTQLGRQRTPLITALSCQATQRFRSACYSISYDAFRLRTTNERVESVYSGPSIHHATSRQKLSINHSDRQSTAEMR